MQLTDFIVPDAILTSLDANTKAEAIRGMVNGLSSAGRISASDTVFTPSFPTSMPAATFARYAAHDKGVWTARKTPSVLKIMSPAPDPA